MTTHIANIFTSTFGHQPEIIVRAPGRINLLGEHTDYNDGFVLPAAIDKSMLLAVSANNNKRLRVFAADVDETIEVSINEPDHQNKGWAKYLVGVCNLLSNKGYDVKGIDCVFNSNIPIGAGLSSSAALTTGFVTAIDKLFNFNIDKTDIIKLAQQAEHEYAGVKCGIMDQFACVFGKKDKAIRLDCRTLDHQYIPAHIPDYQLILCDTQVKHSLASSEYNTRRQECEKIVELLKEPEPGITNLRDVTPETIYKYQHLFTEKLFHRGKYVTEENFRVLQACKHLEQGKTEAFGQLMFETHAGLSNEYEVSCKELDVLVDYAKHSGYAAGARMMGGGFGGCTLNLVQEEFLDKFIDGIDFNFQNEFGSKPGIYKVDILDGVSIISSSK